MTTTVTPEADVLRRLLDACPGDDTPIRDAAYAAGLLWRCVCGWDNPGDADQCDACAVAHPNRKGEET